MSWCIGVEESRALSYLYLCSLRIISIFFRGIERPILMKFDLFVHKKGEIGQRYIAMYQKKFNMTDFSYYHTQSSQIH